MAMISMLGMATANKAWQFIVARFFLGAGIGATGCPGRSSHSHYP